MEIHELNTFTGTLGSADFFATDNGTDTSKVSAETMMAPLNTRIDNIIAGPSSSAEEVIDARLGADGVTYPSLGDAIRGQVEALDNELEDIEAGVAFKDSNILTIRNVDNGKYYNNSDGRKLPAANFTCSHNLIAVDPELVEGAMLISENNENMYIIAFDENKQRIDNWQIFGKTDRSSSAAIPNFAVPENTHFISVTLRNNDTAKELIVRMMKNVAVVEYPYDDPNLIYLKNKWRNQTGNYYSVTNLDCVVISSVKEGDKYYTNSVGSVVLQFFDAANATPLSAQVETITNGGRIFTAPAGTCYAVLNIAHSRFHGSSEEYSTVAYKITRDESVLTIGDSITWLDDRDGYDGATLFLGWQKQINREGYKVVDYGFSGYAYAKDVMDGDTPIGSIYDRVVTDNYDVSGYDYIVLAGGTNDDLYAVPVGTVPNEYQHVYTDAELKTTVGALGAIIEYIRENNPTAKIVLCTQNKSQAIRRPYSEAVQYADGIRGMGKYASCYLCDLFENMNAQPYTDSFTEYYYDSTHPNKAGMVRMGQQILHAIKNA